MEIEDWSGTAHLNALYRQLRELGLESNIAELDAMGFTVLENLLPPETVLRARNAILRICEERTGVKPDLDSGEGLEDWRLIPYLLVRDPVFEEILMNEQSLALATYLLGSRLQLSSMTCHLKGPSERAQIGLHSDTPLLDPLPAYSNVININYALVDYTREGGCLAIVPGSHKLARAPLPSEVSLLPGQENPNAIPLEIPVGSAVIWHGNTWHGSYPRTIPGLRLNLAQYMARPWMKLQERYGRGLPQEIIDRHRGDARFAQIVGLNETMGWQEDGPAFLNPVNAMEPSSVGRSDMRQR